MAAGSSSRPTSLSHIPELDGLRGVAALLVFFHHLCFAGISTQWGPTVLAIRSISRFGAAGVDVFFVLSGFLITSLLLRDSKSSTFYRDFYWKRALRILPLYLTCLIAIFIFFPHTGRFLLFGVFFIANLTRFFAVPAPVALPIWSLAIEEQFYLIWPTVVRRRSVSQVGAWALGILLGCILLRFGFATFGHHNYYLSFLRSDGLAFGALLACAFRKRDEENRRQAIHDRVLIAVLVFGALLLVPLFLTGPLVSEAFRDALHQTAVTMLCGGTVGLLILHSGERAVFIFRSRLLTFFGLISYAFYMLHLPILQAYEHFFGYLPNGDTRRYTIRLITVFLCAVLLSLISRYVIELPALSLRPRVIHHPTEKAETENSLFPQSAAGG